MQYLEEQDLFPGAIVRIYINKRFEGYGILLEEAGEKFTYMEEFEDIIFGKVRWLIEWAKPEDINEKDRDRVMTQRFLAGKRTHRNIYYIAGEMSWEGYAKIYGGLKEQKEEPIPPIPDKSTDLF